MSLSFDEALDLIRKVEQAKTLADMGIGPQELNQVFQGTGRNAVVIYHQGTGQVVHPGSRGNCALCSTKST